MSEEAQPVGVEHPGKRPAAGGGKKKIGRNYTLRLNDEMRDKVQAQAERYGVTEATVIRRACDSYLRQVEVGAELAQVEVRLAASVSRSHGLAARAHEIALRTNNDLQILIAMVDQLVRFNVVVEPEIINPEAANIAGKRRYDVFMSEVASGFVSDSKMARLKSTIMGISPPEAPNPAEGA